MKKIYAFLMSTIAIALLFASCSSKPIEITVPADIVKVAKATDIVIIAEQETTNADDSVTYVITKANHSKLLEDVSDNIDSIVTQFSSLEGADEMFEKIEFGDDYTTLTMKIHDATANQVLLLFILSGVFVNAEMYQYFNGVEDPSITVTIIDAATDEIIVEEVLP